MTGSSDADTDAISGPDSGPDAGASTGAWRLRTRMVDAESLLSAPAGAPAIVPPRPADVVVVVLTFDGRAHLGPCLASVLALTGLARRSALVVADNGSTDDSEAFVSARFPGIRWLALGANHGFADGYDRALAGLDAEWVLVLNNDTRIRSDALAPLCAALAGGAPCAGARLVDWDGRRLDFDGGGMAFTGHGHALGHGRRLRRGAPPESPRPTLFASGAAMLVHRPTFLALGGFEPRYFAYYEDVDLGWRLALAGHDVWHVPAAVVHHRGGGSAAALGTGRRAALHERNALWSVVRNYGDDLLARALPAALALAAVRAGAPLDVIETAMPPDDAWPPLPEPGWAGWPALAPLHLHLPAILATRARIQALRQRTDDAVIARFAQPWAPVPPTADGWNALRRAADRFGLEDVFGPLDPPGARPVAQVRRAFGTLAAEGPRGLVRDAREYLSWRRGRR